MKTRGAISVRHTWYAGMLFVFLFLLVIPLFFQQSAVFAQVPGTVRSPSICPDIPTPTESFEYMPIPPGPLNPGYHPPLCPTPVKRKQQQQQVPLFEGATRLFFDADEIRNANGLITAIGNVRVQYGSVIVTADRVEFNRDTGDLFASGSVSINRGNDTVAGESLSYNINTQRTVLTKAYGIARDVVAGDSTSGATVYFWGDEVRWEGEKLYIRKGVFTSCDCPREAVHYHVSGDEIIIDPKRRIAVRKARFFLKQKQILGIGSLNIPLHQRGSRIQPFFIPKIGRNSVEGEYIKESVNYMWGERDYGSVYLDWYRRIGFGYGFEHFYHFNDRGAGRFYYYTLGSSRTVANRYNLMNRVYYQFSPTLFMSADYSAMRYEYPNFISPPIRNAEFYARNCTDKSENTVLVKNYRYGQDHFSTFNVTNRFFLDDRWRADLVLDYLSSDNSFNQQYRLNTLARLAYQGDLFDSTMEFDYTTGSKSFYVNRLPEVSFRSHPFRLGFVDARVSLAAGNFIEHPSGNKAIRGDMKFSILNKIVPIGSSGRFAFAGGARQFVYGTGDRKYLLRTRAALEQDLGENFSVVVSHNFQDTRGYSPLALDYFDDYHILGTTVAFRTSNNFRAQVTGGYDLDKKIWQTIIPQMEFCPNRRSHVLLGATYDRNNRLWMNAVGEFGVRVSPNMMVKYWGLYDFVNQRLTYQNYMVELESHDFITRLVYKSEQGELWLDLSLKLVPTREVQVGPDMQNPILPPEIYDGAPKEPLEELL